MRGTEVERTKNSGGAASGMPGRGMASPPVCIRLGDLSGLFKSHCTQNGLSAQEEIRDLVSRVLNRPQAWVLERTDDDERVRVALGPHKQAFTQWCKQHGFTVSAAVRILIAHRLEQQIQIAEQQASGDQSSPHDPGIAASPAQAVAGLQEGADESSRLRLRLKPSELSALSRLAEQRQVSPQRLITQILRAFLLKTAAFSQQETVDMGAVNLSLMRIGTNLNQIARQLNANAVSQSRQEGAAATLIAQSEALQLEIRQCVMQLDDHVKACAQALQLSRERWRIELKD